MMVLVLAACPQGLRGDLTNWLYEISAGVFIGKVSARIREHLWERVLDTPGSGRAILVWNSKNEQGLKFEIKNHRWETVDLDGITLLRRPPEKTRNSSPEMRPGWSKASAARRARRAG